MLEICDSWDKEPRIQKSAGVYSGRERSSKICTCKCWKSAIAGIRNPEFQNLQVYILAESGLPNYARANVGNQVIRAVH
ncbi:hypothetical protein Y032_0100g3223 [Ancylostoma ceylanicum]|uniref:Uncharacterized protein n=1 Tax=Ancylostoma ceylanicum TaxID=53326 RepID=A0A016TI85_9BILA|nr:hypothetical protein Y032_0100g3223 [Ancylostoma ceylanicum]